MVVELPGLGGLHVDGIGGVGGLQGHPPGSLEQLQLRMYSNPPFKSKNYMKKPGSSSAVVDLGCFGPACLEVAQNRIF